MEVEREEAIRRRAHQIWEEDGRPEGRESEHWERARQEIEGNTSKSAGGETNPVAAASTTGGIATELQSGGTVPGGGPAAGQASGNAKRSTR